MPDFVRAIVIWLAAMPISASAAFTSIYVLGDSLSDQGNLYTASSVLGPPLGIGPTPTADHYFAGRFSNGEIYAGVLAQHLGLTLTNSLAGGNNFAFGGTRTNYNIVEEPPFGEGPGPGAFPRSAYPWSLNGQRLAFDARVAAGGVDPNGLFIVFSGANDVADIFRRRLNAATTITNAVAGIHDVIESFKLAGAQTVLVPNLPDLGLVPAVLAFEPIVPGISATARALTQAYNSALATMLMAETGIEVRLFDTYNFFRDVILNPTAHGFVNSTQPCYTGFVNTSPGATECTNPEDYVFWDREHPTAAFHAALADQLLILAVPAPGTVLLLISGLVATAFARRRPALPAPIPSR